MILNLHNFDEVRRRAEEFYCTLTYIRCPYFKENVFFNAQGLRHIKFKRHDKARSEQDQYMRLKLLHLAPELLQKTTTLQGIWETKSFERIRAHNRADMLMVDVVYYEFIAVLQRRRIRVVVKQIDGGQKFFWSIIPDWQSDRLTKERTLFSSSDVDD